MSKKNGMTISVKALAERMNLSSGTISMVLNGKGDVLRISQATQERILREAVSYGFKREQIVNRRQTERLKIYVFSPFEERTKVVMGRVIYGLQRVLLEEGLQIDIVMQHYLLNDLEGRRELFSRKYCGGVIVNGLSEKDMLFLLESEFDVPVVLFNRPNEKYSSVYVDNYEAGKKVAYLFARHGWHEVGLLQNQKRSKADTLLAAGFLDGCEGCGLNVRQEYIREDPLDIEGGKAACLQMMEAGLPGAVFITDSNILMGFLNILLRRGIRIPEQIELVTYGDERLGRELYPSQTRLHINVEDMMAACLKMVLDKINGQNDAQMPSMQVIPACFSYQESCPENNR